MEEGEEKQVEPGVSARVSEDHDRAAPRGTGGVKAAGNYAADLFPVHAAQGDGFSTTLYLDCKERKYIEEFSVSNFLGISASGAYVTPSSGSILPSITNQMLMQLARDRGALGRGDVAVLHQLHRRPRVVARRGRSVGRGRLNRGVGHSDTQQEAPDRASVLQAVWMD